MALAPNGHLHVITSTAQQNQAKKLSKISLGHRMSTPNLVKIRPKTLRIITFDRHELASVGRVLVDGSLPNLKWTIWDLGKLV